MTMIDPLGDMITRIRNAQMRSKDRVATPTVVAAAVSVFGCTAELIRGRAYYIDHLME